MDFKLMRLMVYQGNDSRVHQLQQQLLECQRLLTDADARAADCAADARNLKESNDHLTDKLRDEAADRRRADADKLKLAEVVRSLMITNEQLMSRDSRTIPSLPSPRDRSGRSHSPHYLTSTFSASEHARLVSSRQALFSACLLVHCGIA
jgi:septal ring factor EnvC (AmiA/AmiB activator)